VAAFEATEREKIREELKEDARFVDAYVAEHGYPFPDSMADFVPEDEGDDAA